MVHRKSEHEEKVGLCIEYATGNCTYTNQECWWKHNKNVMKDEYSCCHCDETFTSKQNFMKHRKNEHKDNVKMCSHAMNGRCHFSSSDCWYIHEEESRNDKSKNENQNNEVTEKVMSMMEKFTRRLIQLENIIGIK